ncbi:uncharacterized protein LOC112554340 [Pomacea canaliculata]|uniref:uncharacterized protein LOC112554340 n=1 Tax=Pomacea canaliculata TaxID=400727 RepID=UPI000D72F321|nr:uncharacterized protein LOC112554340 [Pomacea canaliculata]
MGKLNIFEITLSNFQGVFYAGQNVQGHCTVELNEKMSMRGIRLKFEGKAYVHWTEEYSTGTGDDRKTEIRHYRASEKYFEQEVLLFGIWPKQGSDKIKLAAGRTTFPFCFGLPPNLPSSFEGAHGYVRYFVKAIIDKPWKFDYTFKRPFTVIGILDLNADANAVMPAEGVNQKTLCCLCCASGPITAAFHLERRGYVPGEAIKLLADIRNNSNRKMEKSYIDLRMITTFHATTKTRTNVKEIGRIVEGPIEEGQSFSWEGKVFVLPPLPPSYLAGCKIIDIRYILQLNVDPCGPSLDLEVPLEIIIGTIPLRQAVELCPPCAPQPFQPPVGFPVTVGGIGGVGATPSVPLQPEMPYLPPSNIPNLPPPSYNECFFGKVNVKDEDDDEHTRGALDFAPMYTYYNWGYPPTTMNGKSVLSKLGLRKLQLQELTVGLRNLRLCARFKHDDTKKVSFVLCRMGKLNIFEITLNSFQGVYYAGQNVQGHCTVELNEEMAMRGIRLKFEGKAYVHWTEQHSSGSGKNRTTRTVHYSATEKYFEQEVLLFGIWPGQGSDTFKLAAGRTTYPFCFVLPPNLPSSFEGAHGYVRYSVKGIIDKPWRFDHTTKRPFTIISVFDLNADANAVMPVESVNQKTLCCLCCASGPITASFHLERRGYVPGEAIKLYADIRNNSNRKMDKSYVDLRMITTFHATTKSRMSVKEVGRVVEGPIEEGHSFSWEGQIFVLPPLPPSYLPGCRIIDIKYILQLNVDPSGPSLDLEVPLEILIGTIPLRQVVAQYPPRAPQPTVGFPLPTGATPSAPFEPMMPYSPPSSIPNLPPPSYNECVFGKVNVKEEDDNEHTRGALDFAPVYTYYDWGYQPTTMNGK